MNILTSISNPQYNVENHRSLEVFYLKKFFNEQNKKLDIIGKKCRTNKDIDFFVDIKNDFSAVKNVFIQLAPVNFFGGVLDKYQVDLFDLIKESEVHNG
jgi:hypothetical protein